MASGTDTTTNEQYIGVRTSRWLYAEYLTNEKELYDLGTDPFELTNVAGTPGVRDQQAALANLLQTLRTARGAACNVPVPPILCGESRGPPVLTSRPPVNGGAALGPFAGCSRRRSTLENSHRTAKR